MPSAPISVFERSSELNRKKRKRPGAMFFIILLAVLGMAYGLYASGIFGEPRLTLPAPEGEGAAQTEERDPPEGEVDIVLDDVLPPREEDPPVEVIAPEPPLAAEPRKTIDYITATGYAETESAHIPELRPWLAKDSNKYAYLTFSNGPSAKTAAILDVLKSKGAVATFFVQGHLAEARPDIVKRAHAEGHIVANQSYTGDPAKVYASVESFKNEITKTEDAIRSIVGEDYKTKVFRFPYGSVGAGRLPYKSALSSMGYVFVNWNCVTGDDQKSVNTSAQSLYNHFLQTSSGWTKPVVLLNDSTGSAYTAEALGMIIDRLVSQGYQFKTLDN